MRGIVYVGEGEVEVRKFPEPQPGPGQVVIEMKAAGLCGSDLHKYHSSREWAQQRKGMISGHEPAGVVADLGRNVDHLALGDRVCVYHRIGCGHCMSCRSGNAAFCDGGSGASGSNSWIVCTWVLLARDRSGQSTAILTPVPVHNKAGASRSPVVGT